MRPVECMLRDCCLRDFGVHDPPAVTTFLFTDVEGSTRLWELEPERMQPALVRHDALARAAVETHRGTVVKRTGDGVRAVFGDPMDAEYRAYAIAGPLHDRSAVRLDGR